MKQNVNQVFLTGIGAITAHTMSRDHNEIEFIKASCLSNQTRLVMNGVVSKYITFTPAEKRKERM